MPKVVILGAGSAVFSRRLLMDIVMTPEFQDSRICLVDIDADRLAIVARLARRMVAERAPGITVVETVERARVLDGADYVVATIRVDAPEDRRIDGAGWLTRRPEYAIPLRYGLRQAVADTGGVGGIFRFLRTWPVMLEIARDIERLCPDALLLNHVNPMGMLCWALASATRVKTVGLCHSVVNTARQLARYMDVPYEAMVIWVAGINHQAWYLTLRRGKDDLYPHLRECVHDPNVYDQDRVRFEILRHFGYFVTESSIHNSELVPYFRRSAEMIDQYDVDFDSASAQYEARIAHQVKSVRDEATGTGELDYSTSDEYTSRIIRAVETDQPFRFNGNVRNTGLIGNLLPDCCVEVPCMADGARVHPCFVGDLPPQLAALNRASLNVQALAVKAGLECDRDAIYAAVQLDPLAASVLTLEQMREMSDEIMAHSPVR